MNSWHVRAESLLRRTIQELDGPSIGRGILVVAPFILNPAVGFRYRLFFPELFNR